ncbi:MULTISPECIES: YdiK family protein [unclassified Virgibacillus]|uniref:YdiK family protein n=1 Tax=unclassified Virgibacillus TaxID=2620237 RepID=UPI0024DE8E9C|nr:YdiK family protein [Virgibacillus sp. LDC-1]
MRISPKTSAIIYLLMAIFFIYVAIISAEETIWNFTTMLFAIFATLDLGMAIRLLKLHFQLKHQKKE